MYTHHLNSTFIFDNDVKIYNASVEYLQQRQIPVLTFKNNFFILKDYMGKKLWLTDKTT